jgi:hypothetical protein
MDYSMGWGSKNPGHLVYLIDLSSSMQFDGKIEMVMTALQKNLQRLIIRNTKNGVLSNCFTVTIIGYHTDIVSLFPSNQYLTGDANDVKALLEDRVNNKMPLFDYSKGGIAEPKWQTYMTNAFNEAKKDIEKWLTRHQGMAVPAPIVINITDGQPEEDKKSPDTCASEALQAARELTNTSTSDGKVLLWNIHITGKDLSNETLICPNSEPTGNTAEDKHKRFLYQCSSTLPPACIKMAQALELDVKTGSKGMVSNLSDSALLTRLIILGSTMTGMFTGGETPKPM